MESKEIIEMNKMVDSFKDNEGGLSGFSPSNFMYHRSWDWFMPAFFKFRDLEFEEHDNERDHFAFIASISGIICYSKDTIPLSACKELVKGIEWYNNLNK